MVCYRGWTKRGTLYSWIKEIVYFVIKDRRWVKSILHNYNKYTEVLSKFKGKEIIEIYREVQSE